MPPHHTRPNAATVGTNLTAIQHTVIFIPPGYGHVGSMGFNFDEEKTHYPSTENLDDEVKGALRPRPSTHIYAPPRPRQLLLAPRLVSRELSRSTVERQQMGAYMGRPWSEETVAA